jgi:tRNA (guanine26-N2/guanine27-N2)-dimethyltransferase
MKNIIKEGLAKIKLQNGVFLNNKMKICRDISSLWISTLPKINILVDGFCASGIRGIRYKKENENVNQLIFFDRSKKAIENLKMNLKLNNLKAETFEGNSNKFFVNYQNFDFCEIDPFGSPAFYLDLMFWADWKQKQRYVSITATDTAVLCGAHKNAAIKIYNSKTINNFACHEIGLRILLGFIARTASKYNWAIYPQVSISKLHFFKVLLKIKKSATQAKNSSLAASAYYIFCPFCLNQKIVWQPSFIDKCEKCSNKIVWAGPLWGDKIYENSTIEKMKENYLKKEFLKDKEVEKFLNYYSQESKINNFYFDIHSICKKYKLGLVDMESIIKELKENGFQASRTTFNDLAIRTNTQIEDLVLIIQKIKKAKN